MKLIFEFCDESYTTLLQDHANLIILRTCSKTVSSAGLRLGYGIASKSFIEQFNKLRLPYLLNQFTIVAAREILQNSRIKDFVDSTVKNIISERQRLKSDLEDLAKNKSFTIKDSQANFFLVRWQNQEDCDAAYNGLVERGILVRNISKGPGLAGCLRITIGKKSENDLLLEAAARCF